MVKRVAGWTVALCVALVILTGAAAAVAVFGPKGDVATVVSVRGETYEMTTGGVYAYNAQRVVAEGVGWDLVTLFVAAPALLMALPALRRGGLRARLFVLGILGYIFYQYLMYALAWALGPLFPVFIIIFTASLIAIVSLAAGIPLAEVARRAGEGFPRRGMALLSWAISAVLLGMWVTRITAALSGQIQGILLGQTTLVVQALDLGLLVPLLVYTGVATWRGRASGYVLSAVMVVKAVTMATALCAMLVAARLYGDPLELPPLIFFGAVAAVSVWLGARMYRSLGPEPEQAQG